MPIGKTAAVKQSPFLMHLEYRVRLPDHDWVVAERHKLIPSVYAGVKIIPEQMGSPNGVTYSGPTYIAIRSGKHTSSSARSHGRDFESVLELTEFEQIAKTDAGLVKPIVIVTVDGGSDENPRFLKVIAETIAHFKKYDLDAIFVATNAPGRSCFNRVERRMAPLSHQLSGLVLPHDSFGNHLDNNCKTIDPDLELKNFANAGNILADIWSSIVIDKEPVVAKYKEPIVDDDTSEFHTWTQDWYCRHVRESQYFLQVRKCTDVKCCGTLRSNLRTILHDGFLPPPIPLKQSPNLSIPNNDDADEHEFCPIFIQLSLSMTAMDSRFRVMPYDLYCPTVKESLVDRCCDVCGLYFASKKSNNIHKKEIHGKASARTDKIQPLYILRRREGETLCVVENCGFTNAEWLDDDDIDIETLSEASSESTEASTFPVINSIHDWMQSNWTEDVGNMC